MSYGRTYTNAATYAQRGPLGPRRIVFGGQRFTASVGDRVEVTNMRYDGRSGARMSGHFTVAAFTEGRALIVLPDGSRYEVPTET